MSESQHATAPPLTRDLDRLAEEPFDLVVVGGGIYGVWATLDAARRGLRVALLEQNDFGSGASANSQRVVHGGLRYLQHGDIKRMRESIRERSTLLRVAGHLVKPMPFLVPTYGLWLRGRPAMWTAMKLNDLISSDRNRNLPPERQLPNGRLISSEQCLRMAPGIDTHGLTGAALFYDAQVTNSERLALAVVRSAVQAGAEVANYARVRKLIEENGRITGLCVEDRLTGREFAVKAKVVLGCAGPWTGHPNHRLLPQVSKHSFQMLRAVALVTRDLFDGMGLALASRESHRDSKELIQKGYRNLFVTSWRGLSLVGTFYTEFDGDPDTLSLSRNELIAFLDEFNQIYPSAHLRPEDVRFAFVGLQPRSPDSDSGEPVAEKRYRLIDHAIADRVEGLITVLGVKWTTARDVAEKSVTLVLRKLGRLDTPCDTADIPLFGAPQVSPDQALRDLITQCPDWADETLITNLYETYGTDATSVLRLAENNPRLQTRLPDHPECLEAQVVYAVQAEMAQTLADVIFHRLGIGFEGYPGRPCLSRCAELMGAELGWDQNTINQQINQVLTIYRRRGCDI